MPRSPCSISHMLRRIISVLSLGCAALGASAQAVDLRIATFNIWDVRTADLLTPDQPRLKAIAEVVQRMRPNILLLNEIAYDMPGGPDVGQDQGDAEGLNAQRFVDHYLSVPQADGLKPIRYVAFMWPTNTGLPSGFDLDNDGKATTEFPYPPPTNADGTPGPSTPEGRAYGNDCWGFGTFPGQYGMALLVDERLTVLVDGVRTFRTLPWDYMPGAQMPTKADGESWFSVEELQYVRLSSKSHWDVPVRLPNGRDLHVLASHPTPPAFDGDEQRNQKRNHDEIRFWADYVSGETWIVDDTNKPGSLRRGEAFVILGDLNADPNDGSSFKDPIDNLLLGSRVVHQGIKPSSDVAVTIDGKALDATDTADFGLRVDYVLPSANLTPKATGIWRHPSALWNGRFPSDHFPVWLDVRVPAAD